MKKLEHIQLLRVLACLGVFITHVAPRMGAAGFAAKAANFGASGVYLFFIISGYLVCMQKGIGRGQNDLRTFYIKRLFRVLPLYYAVILINFVLHTFILQDVTPDPAGLGWLRYLFLTNTVLPAPDNFWGNLSATWTVGLFVVFYLTAPLWRSLIRGVKSGAAVYLAALFLRFVWEKTPFSSYMMVFYYLHFFLLGMLVWELKQKYSPVKSMLILGIAAIVLWGGMKLTGIGSDYFTCWSWVFALILLATQPLTISDGFAKRMIQLVDRYSYSIYLVHAVVIDGIVLIQGKIELPAVIVLLAAVFLTAVGVIAAEYMVERPAKKISARLVAPERI